MSTESNTLTHIQEIYFNVCDQLNGESYKDMGYENKREMFDEFKWKLERIEQHFKQLSGLEEAINEEV
jgi:hypothetical protein